MMIKGDVNIFLRKRFNLQDTLISFHICALDFPAEGFDADSAPPSPNPPTLLAWTKLPLPL